MVRAIRRPARRRRDSGAGQPRMSGVLHVLSAPHSGVAIAAARRRTSSTNSSHLTARRTRPYVVFRDPLFTRGPRPLPGTVRRDPGARTAISRFECETRLDRLDPDLLAALHAAGLRAMSFGVETVSRETLKRSGRRPIPAAHQQTIMAECRQLGIVTAAFYVFGFLQDDWSSIAATIDYSIALGSTVAQFKLLTPYPGTPMWRQLERARLRDRLGAVRRVHADVYPSEPHARASCSSCSAPLTRGSTCARRTWRTTCGWPGVAVSSSGGWMVRSRPATPRGRACDDVAER